MDKETQRLINNIESTESVDKLETTISMLLFGWVMDDHNKEDYENLINITKNRLNVLMVIRGESHPLQNIDLVKDKKKIEMSVMMSMMKNMDKMDKIMETLFDVSMN